MVDSHLNIVLNNQYLSLIKLILTFIKKLLSNGLWSQTVMLNGIGLERTGVICAEEPPLASNDNTSN